MFIDERLKIVRNVFHLICQNKRHRQCQSYHHPKWFLLNLMMLLNFGHVVVVDDVFVVDGVVDVSFLMGNEGVMDLERMKKLQLWKHSLWSKILRLVI